MMNLLDRKEIKKIVGLFLVISLFSSCASYNYSSGEDRSIKITSDNLPDFQVSSPRTSNKLSTASNGVARPRIEKLKKDYLTVLLSHPNYDPQLIYIKRVPRAKALAKDIGLGLFTFGIPVLVDVFNSDFYKVSPKTKEFNIHFEYKQSFMTEEYVKIKDSKNPEDFKTWLSKYTKSVHFQEATDKKDSLELSIALFQETESAIDDYISTHKSSNYLPQASKIKEEMVAARILFEQTKTGNTVLAYENFLLKYPSSLHNTDAHRKLIDAAEKSAISSLNLAKMITYVNIYLIPNSRFLNQKEIEQKKVSITKSLDGLILKENIKSDPKKSYEYNSNLWKAYISILNQVSSDFLSSFDLVLSHRSIIADILFNKLKESNTVEKQSALIAKINNDFPKFEGWDTSKNVLITIIEEASKSSGSLKLFNIGFLPQYFENMSERDALKGRNYYSYRGSDYQSLKGITVEELNLVAGKLNGVSKAYVGNVLDFSMNMTSNGLNEISYYRNGSLVKTFVLPLSSDPYFFEFDNGTNLTMKIFNDITNELGNIEKNVKNYSSSKNYELVESEIKRAATLLYSALDLRKTNPIPDEKLTLLLSKVQSLKSLSNSVLLKVEQEEKQALEKQKKELIEVQKATQNAEVISFNKSVNCACCSRPFIQKNGWSVNTGNNRYDYDILYHSDKGRTSFYYQALVMQYGEGTWILDKFKYCSKKCAMCCTERLGCN